ncbi:hypothetical protein C8Q77DRAFT_1106503 [Trametes polyzona]|nr:hypothetical protein C8Q77DRAFT_1106503 [Trametes polyzona]
MGHRRGVVEREQGRATHRHEKAPLTTAAALTSPPLGSGLPIWSSLADHLERGTLLSGDMHSFFDGPFFATGASCLWCVLSPGRVCQKARKNNPSVGRHTLGSPSGTQDLQTLGYRTSSANGVLEFRSARRPRFLGLRRVSRWAALTRSTSTRKAEQPTSILHVPPVAHGPLSHHREFWPRSNECEAHYASPSTTPRVYAPP